MTRQHPSPEEEEILFRVADLFFRQKKSVTEISDALKGDMLISRQAVYPLLAKARDWGFVKLVPPRHDVLAEQIICAYRLKPGSIRVVNVVGKGMGEHIAAVTAERVTEIVKELGLSGRNPVGLGLGPGRATLDFSRHLAGLLTAEPTPTMPRLKLFAISAGCPVTSPEYASVSFFNLYPGEAVSDCVGLFAENLVRSRDFPDVQARTGVYEAFEKKGDIDIVVTAMGDIEDAHDLLRLFLEKSGVPVHALRKAGWVGNVQYRPFTETGPVREREDDFRAVTLFELDEFVDLAKTRDKHILLIARQCGLCGRTRARALLPLLKEKSLKVWSEIIMDVPTARELLASGSAGAG